MIIWRFVDDRPGHENQTQGLIQALQALSDMTVFEINVLHQLSKPWHWLTKYFPAGDAIPAPDLLLGAGHATHWPMLVARHTFGGRVVVLMQPSFPLCWFDLCVIPEHDHPDNSKSVFVTKGVLNKVQVQDVRSDTRAGLILLGGPSREYRWDIPHIKAQVLSVISTSTSDCERWSVSGSNRTPIETLMALQGIPGLDVVMPDDAVNIEKKIAEANQLWVTEDSVSMVYEALSTGAPTGLLAVPRARVGRVAHGIDQLVTDRQVPLPGSLQLSAAGQPLNEAMRCAQWMQSQWLNH